MSLLDRLKDVKFDLSVMNEIRDHENQSRIEAGKRLDKLEELSKAKVNKEYREAFKQGYTEADWILKKEITTLKEREAKLIGTLRFYANHENWDELYMENSEDCDSWKLDSMDDYECLAGKKARAVLEELGIIYEN